MTQSVRVVVCVSAKNGVTGEKRPEGERVSQRPEGSSMAGGTERLPWTEEERGALEAVVRQRTHDQHPPLQQQPPPPWPEPELAFRGKLGEHLTPDDWEGDAREWAWRYLALGECPVYVACAVVNEVCQRIKNEDFHQFQVDNGAMGEKVTAEAELNINTAIDSHKLVQAVHQTICEVCSEWLATTPEIRRPVSNPWISCSCAIKNSRRRMEDRHVEIADLNIYFGLGEDKPCGFYAVYDGHAGPHAAIYAASHLHMNIVQHPSYPTDMKQALVAGFHKTDKDFMAKASRERVKSGSTVVCAFLQPTSLHVAWLGDSQAVLVRRGAPPIDLVRPHKPDREDERQRIEQLGGIIVHIGTWRVCGTLAVSRALGDAEYKPYVCADPEVVSFSLDGQEDFMVLACDGLWDVMTTQNLTSIVYTQLSNNAGDLQNCSQFLVQTALRSGSMDNITVIVVFLRNPRDIVADYMKGKPETDSTLDTTYSLPNESGKVQGAPSVAISSNNDITNTQPEATWDIPCSFVKLDTGKEEEEEYQNPSPSENNPPCDVLWIQAEPKMEKRDESVMAAVVDADPVIKENTCVENAEEKPKEPVLAQEYFLVSHSTTKFSLDTVACDGDAGKPSSPPVSLFSFDSHFCSNTIPVPEEMQALSPNLFDTPSMIRTTEGEADTDESFADAKELCEIPTMLNDNTTSVVTAMDGLCLTESSPVEPCSEKLDSWTEDTMTHPFEVQQLIEMNKLAVSEPNSLGPLTMEEIHDLALVAEDVVDDESEDGDDWCYFQGTGIHKSKSVPTDTVSTSYDGLRLSQSEAGPISPRERSVAAAACQPLDQNAAPLCQDENVPPVLPSSLGEMISAATPGSDSRNDNLKTCGKQKSGIAQRSVIKHQLPRTKDDAKKIQRDNSSTVTKKPPIRNTGLKTLPKGASQNVENKKNNGPHPAETKSLTLTAKPHRLPQPSTATKQVVGNGVGSSSSAQNTLKTAAKHTSPISLPSKTVEKPIASKLKGASGTLPKRPTTKTAAAKSQPSLVETNTLKKIAKKPEVNQSRMATAKLHPPESTIKPMIGKKSSSKTEKPTVDVERPSSVGCTEAASKLKKDRTNKQISTSTKAVPVSASSATLKKAEATAKAKVPSTISSTKVPPRSKEATATNHALGSKTTKKLNHIKDNAAATVKSKERPQTASSDLLKKNAVATTVQRSKIAKAKPGHSTKISASCPPLTKPDEMLIHASSTKEMLTSPINNNEKGSLDERRKETERMAPERSAAIIGTEEVGDAVSLDEVHECAGTKPDEPSSIEIV